MYTVYTRPLGFYELSQLVSTLWMLHSWPIKVCKCMNQKWIDFTIWIHTHKNTKLDIVWIQIYFHIRTQYTIIRTYIKVSCQFWWDVLWKNFNVGGMYELFLHGYKAHHNGGRDQNFREICQQTLLMNRPFWFMHYLFDES